MVLVQAAPASVAMILREIQAVFTKRIQGPSLFTFDDVVGMQSTIARAAISGESESYTGVSVGRGPDGEPAVGVPRDLVVQAALVSALDVVAPSDAIVGFVVAGGRSRRMGRDKALLGWGGATLLDHAVRTLARCARDVRVLSGLQRRYADRGPAVVVDAIAGWRAAGGPRRRPLRRRAAAGAPARRWTCRSCPAPLLALPGAMRWRAGTSPSPSWPRARSPCAPPTAAACLDAVQAALAAGERKMTSFWPRVRVPASRASRPGAVRAERAVSGT